METERLLQMAKIMRVLADKQEQLEKAKKAAARLDWEVKCLQSLLEKLQESFL